MKFPPTMTWGEFKRYVEAAGVTDDMDVAYIDYGSCVQPTVEIRREAHGVTFSAPRFSVE